MHNSPHKLLTGYVRRLLAALGRGPASMVALARFRRGGPVVEGLGIHMLVSERTIHAGMLAAASFELRSGRRWKWFVHGDGTVTDEQSAALRKTLPDVRYIPRGEADARAAEFLSEHPRCLANRSRHNLFLKFLDVAAFATQPRLIVLDSDVIFFRRPEDILDWVDTKSDECRYNEDTREKFCIPRGEIEAELPVRLPPRFNSGLVLMPGSAFDLHLAEKLLTAFEDRAHAPQFFEQTLYALMAGANPAGVRALPRTYEISWGYFRAPGSICRHYVGEFKHDLLYIEGAMILALDALK
jgi:hypothetical protein